MPHTCLKCGHEDPAAAPICPNCGAIHAKLAAAVARGEIIRSVRASPPPVEPAEAPRTTDEALARARSTGNWYGVPSDMVRRELDAILFATADTLPGFQIATTLGVVCADFAWSFGAVGESLAGLARNLAGSGKSDETVRLMLQGRQEVLHALRLQALNCGADAVVALRFDYEEFSGANQRGVLVVTAIGTAVRRLR
jgi:uncharacterized protein YbjQ (UPF0145 family)